MRIFLNIILFDVLVFTLEMNFILNIKLILFDT